MGFDRALGQVQLAGDLAVGPAARHQPGHLSLAIAQRLQPASAGSGSGQIWLDRRLRQLDRLLRCHRGAFGLDARRLGARQLTSDLDPALERLLGLTTTRSTGGRAQRRRRGRQTQRSLRVRSGRREHRACLERAGQLQTIAQGVPGRQAVREKRLRLNEGAALGRQLTQHEQRLPAAASVAVLVRQPQCLIGELARGSAFTQPCPRQSQSGQAGGVAAAKGYLFFKTRAGRNPIAVGRGHGGDGTQRRGADTWRNDAATLERAADDRTALRRMPTRVPVPGDGARHP